MLHFLSKPFRSLFFRLSGEKFGIIFEHERTRRASCNDCFIRFERGDIEMRAFFDQVHVSIGLDRRSRASLGWKGRFDPLLSQYTNHGILYPIIKVLRGATMKIGHLRLRSLPV